MLSWTISLLISLGLILSTQQYDNLSSTEKQQLESIIITLDVN